MFKLAFGIVWVILTATVYGDVKVNTGNVEAIIQLCFSFHLIAFGLDDLIARLND